MTALISGSVAYDTIMVFRDRFKNHVLPEQVHILNVAFLVDQLRREYGGCAGNIAYNLMLLGQRGLPLSTVGKDFGTYAQWMKDWGVPMDYVKRFDDHYCAQAYITTDLDDNQITAFHPGAMNLAHEVKVPTNEGAKIGIVAPNGRDGMVQHAQQFADAGIPFIFDPGQGLPMFNGEELLDFVEKATYMAVNDYESRMVQDRTGLSMDDLAKKLDALIVTRGAEGSDIYANGETIHVDAVTPEDVLDPTGCGDAYRAGLLYGLLNDLDWRTTGQIASLMGSLKVARAGTQNHHFTLEQFRKWYKKAWGSDF
ncbi:carbohydrate kinase family protein [Aquisalimonas sp. 2447]|uniref:carbohydrate kinase family protein n=1 Tax=Aquisalimonas sp. 2447 TaxID=2740807 RepID=UPI0014324D56|nr:carbohydrate kinase family protein [Aquisalimonas sp. 2447]QIT54014.1 carbohydrate kinase family protein [Aquisalimonas sp. 2447]